MNHVTPRKVMTRPLGTSGIEVSAMGFGCWAIGGSTVGDDGRTMGWGPVDDSESIRAVRRAVELGITLFDTADVYGAGHSERVLGEALAGLQDEVIVATKFGFSFSDDGSRRTHGMDVSPAYIRTACEGSLRRLRREAIDLYQLHVGSLPQEQADAVVETLEELKLAGKIREFGWSADVAAQAQRWAARGTCCSLQFICNVLQDAPDLASLCERASMAALIRSPLASGLLTGKYGPGARLPAEDWRTQAIELGWGDMFTPEGSGQAHWLARVEAVRGALTADGRTLVQGALGWLWARSPAIIPIPGFKTVEQAEENAAALAAGPLPPGQMAQIAALTGPAGE